MCHSSSTLDMIIYEYYIAKVVFFRGSDCQGKKDPRKKKSFSNRETLEQSYWHSNFPLSVVKLLNISQPFMKVLTDFL